MKKNNTIIKPTESELKKQELIETLVKMLKEYSQKKSN